MHHEHGADLPFVPGVHVVHALLQLALYFGRLRSGRAAASSAQRMAFFSD